jgi:hypothetical protein
MTFDILTGALQRRIAKEVSAGDSRRFSEHHRRTEKKHLLDCTGDAPMEVSTPSAVGIESLCCSLTPSVSV